MKMKNLKFLNTLLAVALLATMSLFIAGCDDDDEPAELTLTGLTAGSIDLNGATSPSDVPVSGSYTATFSTDVDATTVTAENIKLIRDYDDAEIPLTFTTSGNAVTITPGETLGTGSLYILTLNGGLKSTGGKMLGETIERNFTTEGTFAPAGVIAHWTFEDSGDDVVGDFDPTEADIVDITYVDSRNDAAGKAASFNGNTQVLSKFPGADAIDDTIKTFGISFWVKPSTEQECDILYLGLGRLRKGFQWEIDLERPWDLRSLKVSETRNPV